MNRQILHSILPFTALFLWTTPVPAQWILQSSGTSRNLYAVFMISADTGTVVGDSGTILQTTNGGATWIPRASGTTGSLNGVFFTGPRTGTAVGEARDSLSNRISVILRTTDGGASWRAQSAGAIRQGLHAVYFTDSGTGTAVGDIGTIMHTTDGGETWTAQQHQTGGSFNSVYVSRVNTGIVVGAYFTSGNGVIERTTDNGASWWDQPLDRAQGVKSFSGLRCVAFTDTARGTAVGTGGFIIRTTNGGEYWKIQPSGTSIYSYLYGVSFSDSNTGTAVGGGYDSYSYFPFSIILRTTDGGESWNPQGGGTSHFLYGVCFTNASRGIAVGELGTILRTTTGGVIPDGIANQPDRPREFALAQNYPNPFNPTTTIRYALPQRSRVTLTVFNTLGQQLATLVNEIQDAGYHDIRFDASGLASGVYLYRLQAGNVAMTKRLLLVR